MSQSKREKIVIHLRFIRKELRGIYQGDVDDGLFLEGGEICGMIAQMEALLELFRWQS